MKKQNLSKTEQIIQEIDKKMKEITKLPISTGYILDHMVEYADDVAYILETMPTPQLNHYLNKYKNFNTLVETKLNLEEMIEEAREVIKQYEQETNT